MPTAAPFTFFDLHVTHAAQLGPSMRRVTLKGAADLASGGRDQSFSLFLPQPHQVAPVLPSGPDWFARWRAMDPAERAVMRAYTVREQRGDELDVDFALHSVGGPASRWATRAAPGDHVRVLGPSTTDNKSVGFRPPAESGFVLLCGDETALPAIAGILSWLPPGTPALAWVEVPRAADVQDLPGEVHWLIREDTSADRTEAMLDAVRSTCLPRGRPYAWLAGEAGTVRALRRHLLRERGFDRREVAFSGYWRRGSCEEQLAEEAAAGIARVPEE